MSLHTMETRSVQSLYGRLTEMEKIDLRRASPDRVAYLAYTIYNRECGGSPAQLAEVQQLCIKQMQDYDVRDMSINQGFIPAIWKF